MLKKVKFFFKAFWPFFVSLVVMFTFLFMILSLTGIPKNNILDDKIVKVEKGISDLKNLEVYLTTVKRDMVLTEQAKIKLQKEYQRALELKKVTKRQLETIKVAVSDQTWWDTVVNYFVGFILGVASSILGAIILDKLKKRKVEQNHDGTGATI